MSETDGGRTSVLSEVWVSTRHTLVLAGMAVLFTFLVSGIAQLFFNNAANGSLVSLDGQVIGSSMIGQSCPTITLDKNGKPLVTLDPRWFQSRLSWTVNASTGSLDPCNAADSTGSNFGPSNPLLAATARAAVKAYEAHGCAGDAPIDLVTSDFTGFDPDISEAAALYQVPMTARARGLSPARVAALVESQIQGRILWVFGEPHVNVLQLNMGLDQLAGR